MSDEGKKSAEELSRELLAHHPDKKSALLLQDAMRLKAVLAELRSLLGGTRPNPERTLELAQAILDQSTHALIRLIFEQDEFRVETRERLETIEKHLGIEHVDEQGLRRYPPSGTKIALEGDSPG